jgi:hypothetical protein
MDFFSAIAHSFGNSNKVCYGYGCAIVQGDTMVPSFSVGKKTAFANVPRICPCSRLKLVSQWMAIQRAVHDIPHETPWPHVTRQFTRSSQLGRCIRILGVRTVSVISLEKAHPHRFQLSTLFSWGVYTYSIGCWIDTIKGPCLVEQLRLPP